MATSAGTGNESHFSSSLHHSLLRTTSSPIRNDAHRRGGVTTLWNDERSAHRISHCSLASASIIDIVLRHGIDCPAKEQWRCDPLLPVAATSLHLADAVTLAGNITNAAAKGMLLAPFPALQASTTGPAGARYLPMSRRPESGSIY